MTSTKQLAKEAEMSRAQLAATLSELRSRLSPQNLRQEAVRAMSNSGPARFAAGLKEDAANSAVPVAMLAAGVLWAISNKRSASRSQTAAGSVDSLVALADSLVSAAAAATRTVGATASSARAKGEALFETARENGAAAVRAAEAAGGNGRAVGSRIATGATSAIHAARTKTIAATDAASQLTERASKVISTAAKLASKDPVFIAGAGIAAAGIAAAVFGISRQREFAAAAGELVEDAGSEAGIVPVQPPDQSAPFGTGMPRAEGYGRDPTGAPELAEEEPGAGDL